MRFHNLPLASFSFKQQALNNFLSYPPVVFFKGTTGGLVFIATLAGSYAIKAGSDLAEEYFAAQFLARLGVPVPQMRVIHSTDNEHSQIIKGWNWQH